jgi:hypothetical protein
MKKEIEQIEDNLMHQNVKDITDCCNLMLDYSVGIYGPGMMVLDLVSMGIQ